MKVDSDPLHVVNVHFVEPMEVLMIKANDGLEDEQAGIINSLAALTIKTTDGFESEQAVAIDPKIVATIETIEGPKSGNGNLSKPKEVMAVDIAEETEVNQDDKEKMDCETKIENFNKETVIE